MAGVEGFGVLANSAAGLGNWIVFGKAITGSATAIAATLTSGSNWTAAVIEVENLVGSGVIPVPVFSSSAGTLTLDQTTTAPNQFVVSGFAAGGVPTISSGPGAGWTVLNAYDFTNAYGKSFAWAIPSSPGAINGTWVIPTNHSCDALGASPTPLAFATVTFNSEGGSAVSSISDYVGLTIWLPSAPTYAGHTFTGWFAAPSGGTALTSPYTISASTTLYAQWSTATSYTVTFNANGGTGTMSPETNSTPTALSPCTFIQSGYTFSGWNTAANGSGTAYGFGATYAFTANVTLYAQWVAIGATKPFVGYWIHGNIAAYTGIPATVIDDFDVPANNWHFYTYPESIADVAGGQRFLLYTGNATSAQATADAEYLVANGMDGTIIRPMAEGGSLGANDGGNTWNEVGMTPTQFWTAFGIVAAAYRSVSSRFEIMYCPQLNSVTSPTNQGNGWTNLMTGFPGLYNASTNPNGVDYGGWDGYDSFVSIASWQAQAQSCADFYNSHGVPWIIGEWGIWSTDDPDFIDMVANLCTTANGCAGQVYFAVSQAAGGGPYTGLTNAPLSLARFTARFG
jgi:uncharacterized repeat protein (TIGR02543 family)